MLDDTLLGDGAALLAADTTGVLRAAATAGAQVRSLAQAASEADVHALAGVRPRAVVLLRRPGSSAWSAPVVAALLGPGCPVPVVVTDEAPSWIGALDVLIAHTADPTDTVLADSIGRAVHRGAEVVVSAPAEGLVAAAGAGRARLLEPRVPVPPGLDFPRALTAGLVAVAALGVLPTRMTTADLDRLADELDAEAERDHPSHEPFVNPAKALALRLADRLPLLWGTDGVAAAVAGYAASALATHAGIVAYADDVAQAVHATALRRRIEAATAGDDIFHDPFADEAELPVARPRVVLLGTTDADPAREAAQRTGREWPNADVLHPSEEIPAGSRQAEVLRAAVLATRFDVAALYLGLVSGGMAGPAADSAAGSAAGIG
jgi:hypothetical protein